MQNNDATALWKAWPRLGGPWNLGCLSACQVDSWHKYNRESLLRNLKLPKGWVWSSTPIEHKCSAYLEARKQTILIVFRNNRLLFQQATVIVMSKFQKRRKLLLRVSNGEVNDQNDQNKTGFVECAVFTLLFALSKRDCTVLLQSLCFYH